MGIPEKVILGLAVGVVVQDDHKRLDEICSPVGGQGFLNHEALSFAIA